MHRNVALERDHRSKCRIGGANAHCPPNSSGSKPASKVS